MREYTIKLFSGATKLIRRTIYKQQSAYRWYHFYHNKQGPSMRVIEYTPKEGESEGFCEIELLDKSINYNDVYFIKTSQLENVLTELSS